GVVGADGEHGVAIAGESAVGRIRPAPADVLATPDQHPRRHRAGALEPVFSGRLRGPQIAADIGSRQTETSHPGNHDMGKILNNAKASKNWHRENAHSIAYSKPPLAAC